MTPLDTTLFAFGYGGATSYYHNGIIYVCADCDTYKEDTIVAVITRLSDKAFVESIISEVFKLYGSSHKDWYTTMNSLIKVGRRYFSEVKTN